VLTAAHCIERVGDDGIDRSLAEWKVYVSPSGLQGSPATAIPKASRTFLHTTLKSYPIPYFDAPTPPAELRDSDLAVVRLDERVPHPIGLPARIPAPGDVYGCGPTWNGKLVGFSPNGFDEAGYDNGSDGSVCSQEPGGWIRRSGPDWLPWHREAEGLGSSFVHEFTAGPHRGCYDMDGIGLNGDSGGSLYKLLGGGERAMLCGVISGDGPNSVSGTPSTNIKSDYHTASLDHPICLDWLYKGDDAYSGLKDFGGIRD